MSQIHDSTVRNIRHVSDKVLADGPQAQNTSGWRTEII
jgi:hypothetical protein